MKLTVKLNQLYKSFEQGFQFELNGSLVLLSGVNGGGKSQLFEIIRRKNSIQPQNELAAEVFLDGNSVSRGMIGHRSFKENIKPTWF